MAKTRNWIETVLFVLLLWGCASSDGNVTPFELQQVRLLPSRFTENVQRDSAWMMSVGADRLLYSFRLTAGLCYPDNELALEGWEAPDCELRGHTTGHMLSACALMYGLTRNECFKEKGDSLVQGLYEVQRAYGTGYLSAYPEEQIDRNIRGEKVWAPWYTLHKILSGLIDQYRITGSELALEEACGMVAWAYEKLSPLSDETRRLMLRNEFGGVTESWWDLYDITGDNRAKWLAEFFYHNEVIDPLRSETPDFGTKHTNTFIPKVIAEVRDYEITGAPEARTAVEFFWKEMMAHHLYATGSLSDKEHFFPEANFKAHITGVTGETCCTYNMLKLARHLFCWQPSSAVGDYYELALYNHILGGQDPQTGMISYFLPLKTGTHKVYSTQFQSFWCCVGSSFESQAKFGESIYYHNDRTLYVNLFIPSELDWDGFKVRLETVFPSEETVHLTVMGRGGRRIIALRRPSWSGTPILKVNEETVPLQGGDFLTVDRRWKRGDRIEVTYPMSYRVVPAAQDPSVGVVMYGPIVMAEPLGTEGFIAPQPYSDPSLHNDYYTYDYHIPSSIPEFRPVPSDYAGLKPLYEIHRERYEVYWDLIP